ncbi:MAG: GNAT family N-acetyltransferase [Candidatus Sulfotelmatobacter sp.]
MHPLNNIIWQALTTRQAEFAQSVGEARRFVPEVGPLAGFRDPNDADYESLAGLAKIGGTIAVFLDLPYQPQSGWSVVAGAPLLQMVHSGAEIADRAANAAKLPIVDLGAADSTEMIELAALTKPGPFGPRTHELGSFFGIRVGGKLAAMAGERMKVPGYAEVSAVCTHPDHTGHGYAAALMTRVMQGIVKRGELPFLHVRGDNLRAIELYNRLGFLDRKSGYFVVLRRE